MKLPVSCVAAASLLLLPAAEARGQSFVSSDGGPPPILSAIPAPPLLMPPPCAPLPPPCFIPVLPGFPPGIFPPSIGGEAVDEATGTTYLTDGITGIGMTPYPAVCPAVVPPFFFPFGAWPPGPCGPIGPPGAPIVAMSDAAGAGTVWVLDAVGIVSLIPIPPGPPIAQAIVPPPILPFPTGVAFDPAAGMLWFTGAFAPGVVGTPVPAGFACAPLPIGPVFPTPPCLPPPFVGVTVDTAMAAPAPANLFVTNGLMLGSVGTGACPCPVLPPAVLPTTDLDFATLPYPYGAGCGCGPPAIGFAGGYPVLGNGGFGITATGIGAGAVPAPVGFLFLSVAPAIPPIPLGFGCALNLFPGFLLLVPPVTPTVLTPGIPCPRSATHPLPIPPGPPALVGVPLYLQWVFFPVPASPLGFELSDGLELTIGFP